MGFKDLISASDPEVMAWLGARLRAVRRSQRVTLQEAAARTGLSRRTVYRAELGDNPTLLTLVRLLRLYGRIGSLESFLPEPELSPMALVEGRGRKRSDG